MFTIGRIAIENALSTGSAQRGRSVIYDCLVVCCSTIQYNDLSNRTFSFSAQSAPPAHQKKATLLLYFAEYMYTHLSAGGNIGLHQQQPHGGPDAAAGPRDAPVFMKNWFRTDRAIVMYLSNGTLQV